MNLAIATAVAAVISFLICGIPFGLVIANAMNGVDVRKSGSGNIGMTNVARTAGGKAAALTFLCDVGKGTLCMLLFRFLIAAVCFGGNGAMLAHNATFGWVSTTLYCACVLGHIFSPYLNFHGGKGISVGLGAGLGLYWPLGLSMLAVFLVLTIPTRYVSLGSVAAAASLPLFSMLYGITGVALIPTVIVAVVVIWSHRQNLVRLMHGEERRFQIHHSKEGEGK
ncbi:MAG: glycerol-3-phosphate 1-O-acyltransferase PlsY [Coriobacteriales bacterium]|nr:glycerol-3-phosphate 1-O-acyltransferase PlsY [Coriobacteriales bacterium]